jgi:geranylgeranyl pyrophosphate synthase
MWCCFFSVAAAAGKQTVNTMFGTRVAVLAGDFLFAQASWLIANLENLEVRSSCNGN